MPFCFKTFPWYDSSGFVVVDFFFLNSSTVHLHGARQVSGNDPFAFYTATAEISERQRGAHPRILARNAIAHCGSLSSP